MAISVSYLEAKAHPDWGSFSKAFPHKPGQQTVSTFAGNFQPPESATVKHDTVSSFKGGWTFPALPTRKDGRWIDRVAGSPIPSFSGQFTPYPASIKRELVKSSGELPPTPGSKSMDRWAEIGQLRFEITIDGKPLGIWSKIEGLAMKVEVGEHRTGDGMNYRWTEMAHVTYPNIKLTRAATSAGCGMVLAWLEICQFHWARGMTAQIQATPMWRWADESTNFKIGLIDVMPVGWTGLQFMADGKVAMETLEIAHSGFLSVTPVPGHPKTDRPGVQPLPPDRKEPTPLSPPPPRTTETMIAAGGGEAGGA